MSDEKKIIIDEDWKAQVQAEKEAAEKKQSRDPVEKSAADSAATGSEQMPLPPASLEMLLTMLATEAMVALGHVPHPATGQPQADRGQAKYLIDLIEVLREKTKGNLTPTEQQIIDTLLHQLRLAYVEAAGGPSPGPQSDHLA